MDTAQWIPVHGYLNGKVINVNQITTLTLESTGERRDEFSRCLRATMSDGNKHDLFVGDEKQCKAAHSNFVSHFGGTWTLFQQPPSTRPKR